MDQRRNLTEALGKQGLGADVQTEIRQLVDGRARQAGEIGRAAAERTDQWKAKTESIVAARNDQLAQRRAANAGRSTGSGRSCTTRPDPSSAQEHPRARTTTHRMNSPEIGR
ncbi:hypothetical protein ACWEP5_36320 [Nocardia niigatensis]